MPPLHIWGTSVHIQLILFSYYIELLYIGVFLLSNIGLHWVRKAQIGRALIRMAFTETHLTFKLLSPVFMLALFSLILHHHVIIMTPQTTIIISIESCLCCLCPPSSSWVLSLFLMDVSLFEVVEGSIQMTTCFISLSSLQESTMAEEFHRSSAAEISVTSNGDLDQSPETVFQRVRESLETASLKTISLDNVSSLGFLDQNLHKSSQSFSWRCVCKDNNNSTPCNDVCGFKALSITLTLEF